MKNKRVLPPLLIVAVIAFAVASCGGKADDTNQGGRTPELVQEDIRAEIAFLNYCETVGDCAAVNIPGTCSGGYVNADADRSNLHALIAEYSEVGGLEPPCIAICETGILSCAQGRCETRPASPSELAGLGELSVCL
jgi:hypothetical protein